MTEQKDGEKRRTGMRKTAVMVMALMLLVIAALNLLLNVALNTPQATSRVSRLLSDALHQPATVTGMNFAGGTVIIHGLTIANPSGFSGGNLLFARKISVTPSWSALLAGRKSFTTIDIDGLKLSLTKNNAGAWNFSGLTKLSGKKSSGDIFINHLHLEKTSISVNGSGIADISLAINNLSTKGSTSSGILLTFNDEYGAPYRLEGNGRLGVAPSLDLSLSAPSLSYKALRRFKLPMDPEKGKGKFLLTAQLHGDELKLAGNAAFDRLTLLLKGEEVPLSGSLDFRAAYNIKKDTAILEKCALRVDGVIRLKAGGRMVQVKKERVFTAELSHDGVEVEKLFALLPQKLRSDLSLGGTVLPGSFRIAGSSATGVTSGRATFALRHGRLGKGGRMLAGGIAADSVLARESSGWGMRGKVFQQEKRAGTLVQSLNIPVVARFSDRLRPLKADLSSFSATVNGIPVKGDLSYQAAAPTPLAFRLDLPEFPLAVLVRSLPIKNMMIAKGSVTASVRGSGRGIGEFQGDVNARVGNLKGMYGGKKLALAELSTRAAASLSDGKIAATGSLKAGGGLFDGKKVAASLSYRIADGVVILNNGDCTVDHTSINFTEISGAIPKKNSAQGESKIPITVRFTGIQCRRDDSGVSGLSGNLKALLVSDSGGRRLEGDGSVTAPTLTYMGKGVGSLTARLNMAKGKGTVSITGKFLGGDLTASANGDPFTAERDAVFKVNLARMQGAGFPEVLGKASPVKVSRGMLNATVTGNYSAKSGVLAHMTLSGADIALTGKNGRALLDGGALKLESEWVDGSILVKKGVATIGKEMEIDLLGKLSRAASSDREGEFNLSLPKKVTLITLLDTFANILPRSLQEAAASGNMAAHARLRIKGKRVAVDGKMTLEEGGLEIPSQKLTIAGINGMIPFAVDFAEKSSPKLPERLSFSRENYSRLLTILQQAAKSGDILSIGTVRFGTTDFGKTAIAIRGDNGWTEIVSLSSSLFQGALSGRGFFRYQGGAQYGADILIHDMSLRELCNSYPAIKGYLSGRVDGFVSLFGNEKGLIDIKGLVNIWTRSAKNEKMLVSKEFLQKLAGKKIKRLFFQNDRPYDRGEIGAYMDEGFLTFTTLDISHTNFLGIKDLSVSVAPVQNRISLDHLFTTIREAATRGKAATGGATPEAAPASSDFKWEE
jgi:hypothetical protein